MRRENNKNCEIVEEGILYYHYHYYYYIILFYYYFLTNQSKTKTFIDLKVTRKPKPTKNSARPYLNEIPAHFIHEIKTKGYNVIGVDLFLPKLMRFLRKKKNGLTGAPYTTHQLP